METMCFAKSIKVYLLQAGLSWIEAQGECELLGGYLAEVKTEGEHEFLKNDNYSSQGLEYKQITL